MDPPLIQAARSGNLEQVERLIAAGADVNIQSQDLRGYGNTALHEVVNNSQLPSEQKIGIIKALLEAPGIDLNRVNGNGYTAFIWFIGNILFSHDSFLEIIKLFLDAGVNVNSPIITHNAVDRGLLPLEFVIKRIESFSVMGGSPLLQRKIELLKDAGKMLLDYKAEVKKENMGKLKILGTERILSVLGNAAMKRRLPVLAAWSRAHENNEWDPYEYIEKLREANAGAGVAAADHNNLPPLERVNAEEAGNGAAGGAGAAAPRNDANRGGARRRRSLKKRKASTTRRRRHA